MTETKRYEDYLLTPYMDGFVDTLPLKPGHEHYLAYMPKVSENQWMSDTIATRRASCSDRHGVTIEQSFQNEHCTIAMHANGYHQWFSGAGFTNAEEVEYNINAAAHGNRQFDVLFKYSKNMLLKESPDGEPCEAPAKQTLEGLDTVLSHIQQLDQPHVVRLAEGDRLTLSDDQHLRMLVEAVKENGTTDKYLREVQILAPTESENCWGEVKVIRRGSDDVYLKLQLLDFNRLGVYAEGVPVPGMVENPYDIDPKHIEELRERVQGSKGGDRLPHIINSVRERRLAAYERSLVAWDAVEHDSSRLSYRKVIDLNNTSFEDAVVTGVKDALYHVSREYRTDMELKRREEQLDISDLSEDTQQSEL